jgi:Xaa-Pro aminopeptidase
MCVTIEPGIYEEGDFGIRIENNVVTVKDEKNKYGQFMRFEMMTFVPIDLDAIDPEELTKSEREWLNDYHRQCYEKLSPYMTDEENEWLREYTRAI